MKQIKKIVKNGFHFCGLNVSRIQALPPSPLLYHRIDLLLDVGANIGQFALRTREQGFKKRIVSFEPLQHAHNILQMNSRNDENWIIHERCAVGSEIGEARINISKNSYSSSLLPMLESHSNAAPDSIYVGDENTNVITLDSIFDAYYRENERIFLKIDTQGFEKQVLDGAKDCLKRIIGVQLELSIVPLYEAQELYEYFFMFFKKSGYILWSLIPGFTDSKTGQLLQFDALFIRQSDITLIR